MDKLHQTAEAVLTQMRASLAPSTFCARARYIKKVVELAVQNQITAPCQRLFDLVMAQATTVALQHEFRHALRLIDREAGSKMRLPDSILLNLPKLPAWSECKKLFINRAFPVADDEIDTWPLILLSLEKARQWQSSESTLGRFMHAWLTYYSELYIAGNTNFRRASVEDWIDTTRRLFDDNKIEEWVFKIRTRAGRILLEVAQTGDFKWKIFHKPVGNCGNEKLDELLAGYLDSKLADQLKQSTVKLHSYAFRSFLKYSGIKSLDELKTLTAEHVQNTMTAWANVLSINSRSTFFPMIKTILSYFYSQSLVAHDYAGIVMSPVRQKCHIRPYIDPKDESNLLQELEKVSMRDKAMILLCLRCGLRASDVINLKFSEIDWQNDKIRLVQKKTSKPLELPLLEDVGNAIYDYIMNERPKAADKSYPYIFLHEHAPYLKLTGAWWICSKIFDAAGIEVVNGNKRGTHVLRHTFTYNLVKAKVPLDHIRDAMGHTSKDSTKAYIAMDEAMLKQCALDFSLIGQKYWDVEE